MIAYENNFDLLHQPASWKFFSLLLLLVYFILVVIYFLFVQEQKGRKREGK